jgi:hypothetical protein
MALIKIICPIENKVSDYAAIEKRKLTIRGELLKKIMSSCLEPNWEDNMNKVLKFFDPTFINSGDWLTFDNVEIGDVVSKIKITNNKQKQILRQAMKDLLNAK